MLFAAPPAMAQSRGELLYTTHCIACHTAEMHWRDKRSATGWASLKVQVRRWQDAASLAWSDGDNLEVSRYLNDSIYHFEQTTDPLSSLSPSGNQSESAPNRPVPRGHAARNPGPGGAAGLVAVEPGNSRAYSDRITE
jgi:hypothetical protein